MLFFQNVLHVAPQYSHFTFVWNRIFILKGFISPYAFGVSKPSSQHRHNQFANTLNPFFCPIHAPRLYDHLPFRV